MKIRKQKNANTKLKKRNLLDGLSMRADMKEYRINMMNLKNKIYRIDLILKTEKMEWKKKMQSDLSDFWIKDKRANIHILASQIKRTKS